MEDGEDEIQPIHSKDQPKSKWDDEDVDDDDDDIKESCEDEDDPRQPVAKVTEEKAVKKPVSNATEKKEKTIEIAKEEPLDPVAEKLRQQRLVEEADYRSTAVLFPRKVITRLDNFIPKSEIDLEEYAELVSHKLRPYDKSYHYIALLKKLKVEKEAASKKKTGGKKKTAPC